MSEIFGPILPLQLDSRNTPELLRAIQTRINLESEGKLNDFTPASPLSAITEGQAFAQAELLFYLNNLPEAFTLQWLRNLGVQRKLGSRAYVDVTFLKVPGFNGVVVIPAGTKVTADTLNFLTLEEVRILPGEAGKTVACRSEKWGSIYNVGSNLINKIERNFVGLQSLTNTSRADGGTDLESVDEMKVRAFSLLGRRNLTTSGDFESEFRNFAPAAAFVKALTYEERFALDKALSGSVVLVAGDENGQKLPNAVLSEAIRSLRPKVTLGTNLSVIAPDLIPVDVVIEVTYDPRRFTGSSDSYASELFSVVNRAIGLEFTPLGQPLDYQRVSREVYNLEFVSGITTLDLKLMTKNPLEIEGICAGFSGEESEDGLTCFYNYSEVIDKNSPQSSNPTPITAYKAYRVQVTLTSERTFSPLTYTYDNLYTP